MEAEAGGPVELSRTTRESACGTASACEGAQTWPRIAIWKISPWARHSESGSITVSADEIKAFAAQFDPQPFHLDEKAAAATFFGGLVASGWHTAALTMRLIVDSELKIAGGSIGAGAEELRWPRPVRPGDTLHAVIRGARRQAVEVAARPGNHQDANPDLEPGRPTGHDLRRQHARAATSEVSRSGPTAFLCQTDDGAMDLTMTDSYQPIENYGVIGNMRTAALVGMNGSIDWLCLPYFDSPSVFAAILDDRKGGRFRIAPVVDNLRRKQYYWPGTNILITRFLHADGVGEVEDYMPVGAAASRG